MEKNKYNTLVGVVIILEKDGKYLLHKRKNCNWMNDHYALIGRTLEENETLTKAVIRETQEEIGITLKAEDIKMVHVINTKTGISFFFKASKWEGIPEIKEPHKCEDLCWLSLNEFPSNTGPHTKIAIEKIKKNEFYTEID